MRRALYGIITFCVAGSTGLTVLGSAAAWAQTTTSSQSTAANGPATSPLKMSPEARFADPPDSLQDVLADKDQTGTPPKPAKDMQSPPATAKPGEKRPTPNYDRREDAPATAGEVLVWIPRVLLFPAYAVTNYLLRWPIVGALTWAEKVYLFTRIERLLSFRDGQSVIFPSFFTDFGLRPAVGLTLTNRNLFVRGNTLTLGASYGGDKFVTASLANDTTVLSDDAGAIGLRGSFVTRPDLPWYGFGSQTRTDDRFNTRIRTTEAQASFRAIVDDLDYVNFSIMFRDVGFLEGALSNANDPNLDQLLECQNAVSGGGAFDTADGCAPLRDSDTQLVALPPGYVAGGYQLLENRITAKVDTRSPDTEYEGGTGMLFELFGSFEFDPTQPKRNFIRWGGEVAGFYDFTGVGHTLALRVYSEFIENTGSDDEEFQIPFTELPALGGLETMRGYLPRRFVGESTFTTTLSYRYPVWSLIDAEVFASLGNAYLGRWRSWNLEEMYLNGGLSLRTNLSRDVGLQVLVAVGTNRLDSSQANGDPDNFGIDAFRLNFGIFQGF